MTTDHFSSDPVPPKTAVENSGATVGAKPKRISFQELVEAEAKRLGKGPLAGINVTTTSSGGEPFVRFNPIDYVGLGLSGGGIRSATFNLGVLQALSRIKILPLVDYMATVSGGGYIGSFWSAWLARNPNAPTAFPQSNPDGSEAPEIRHLREFSRFLLPRVKPGHTEFWVLILTVVGGMIPTMAAAAAVIGLVWSSWILAVIGTAAHPLAGPGVFGLSVLAFLVGSERVWQKAVRAESDRQAGLDCILLSVLAAEAVVYPLLCRDPMRLPPWANTLVPPVCLSVGTLVFLGIRVILARYQDGDRSLPVFVAAERVGARLLALTVGGFLLGGVWLGAAMIAEKGWTWVSQLGGVSAATAAAFALTKNWLTKPIEETRSEKLANFVLNRLKRATPKYLATLTVGLLFLLGAVLLYLWGLFAGRTLVDLDLHNFLWYTGWLPLLVCFGVVAVVVVLVNPARIGLHEFYRSRIARCYLGASHRYVPLTKRKKKPAAATIAKKTEPARPKRSMMQRMADPFRRKKLPAVQARSAPTASETVAANRQVWERRDDDLRLEDLKKIPRPVHLICVAVNNISGDPLPTLYRAAASGVLSAEGLTVGDDTAPMDKLRVSSAVTASAAAFNSQMGRVSVDLGPAVGFLACALNLRLGLWLPYPGERDYAEEDWFLGRFFFYELLGHSHSDGKSLHLSDGNHFENFGLYELVRRHCRYIIISDCGADPDVGFDDLANVFRRVREDFGVEIELDVTSLRPDASGLSKAHAVVGTIHYNTTEGLDKGTLIYIKPVLTGDEPPDVAQYRTRNAQFPHETTLDQFYDEAQWESYRRLGEHATDVVLGFFEPPTSTSVEVADNLFRDARTRWHPAAADHQTSFLEMSERCSALEQALMTDGPECLRAEFFPEVRTLYRNQKDGEDVLSYPVPEKPLPPGKPNAEGLLSCCQNPPPPDDPGANEIQVLGYLISATQIMEDVWVAGDLERFWSHPLNEGWMNYFHRWNSTAAFRRWWPVISSLYSIGFRSFVQERFHHAIVDTSLTQEHAPQFPTPRLKLIALKSEAERKRFLTECVLLGNFVNSGRSAAFTDPEHVLYCYELTLLPTADLKAEDKLAVGLVWVKELGSVRSWKAMNLFVPERLHGSGFLSKLLDALIAYYTLHTVGTTCTLEVEFNTPRPVADPTKSTKEKPRMSRATRYQRTKEIEFYKSRGFIQRKEQVEPHDAVTLTLVLGPRKEP